MVATASSSPSWRGLMASVPSVKIRDEVAVCTAMQRLLGPDRELCDFTFIVGEGKERLPAVRSVVAVRSAPLRAMLFDDKFKHCKQELELSQWSPRAFNHMLEFLHCGATNVDAGTVLELLQLADFFQINELKVHCKAFLAEKLSIDTVATLLVEAGRFNEEQLRDRCKDFFLASARVVFRTEAFRALPEEVLCEVLTEDDLIAEEWEVYQAVKVWAEAQENPKQAALVPLRCVRLELLSGEQLRLVLADGLMPEGALLDAALDKLDCKETPKKRRNTMCFLFCFDQSTKGNDVQLSDDRQCATFGRDCCVLGDRPLPEFCRAYWEVVIPSGSNPYVGVAHRERINVEQNMGMGGGIAFRCISTNQKWNEGSYRYFGRTGSLGDHVGVLVDLPARLISFYLNGEPLGVAFDDLDPSKQYWPCVSHSYGDIRLVPDPRVPACQQQEDVALLAVPQ